MLDDAVVLILMVWDLVSCMPVFALIRHLEKRRNYFYSTLSQVTGANLFVFSICLFCFGLLCFVRSIYV